MRYSFLLVYLYSYRNITEWEWKQGTNATQAYTFTYDGISRLTDNKQYSQSGSNWNLNNQFVEQGLTYDLNGNIKSLNRYSNSSMLDNLGYSYSGNQLTTLSETIGTTTFSYDKNGNMTKDSRKNLDYQYNSLNLLSEVSQGSTSKAKYTYAADGTKLAVSGGGDGYDYRGSLIYKRSSNTLSLESAAFSDGRITKTNSTYVPNYFITDHLGSVRVIFDASGTVLEQNDYYAFGGRHLNSSSTASDNRFRYNGKELQTTGDVCFLDYGARMYDSKLVRTHSQDLLQEDYYGISPYAYCFNDPVRYVDLFGLKPNDDEPAFEMDPIGDVIITPAEKNPWIIFIAINSAKGRGDMDEAARLRRAFLNDFDIEKSNREGVRLKAILKGYGMEILSQWMTPELVVAGLSGGIAGLQVVNSPLKATTNVGKGAGRTAESKVTKNVKNKTSVTDHGKERMIQRNVSDTDIQNAINNPLKVSAIKLDQLGRPSQKIVGESATVIINPETGKIITTWKTSSKIKL